MKNSLLVYASKISQIYKKDVWLKLEILNPTGSHKDRESVLLIKEAKKKNFKSIGCASTGNLAISLAFFSKYSTFVFASFCISVFLLPKKVCSKSSGVKSIPVE